MLSLNTQKLVFWPRSLLGHSRMEEPEDEAPFTDKYTDESNQSVSPLLLVGSFLSDCEQVMGSEEVMQPAKMKKSSLEMAQMMGTSQAIVDELEKFCSPATLRCDAEDDNPLDEGTLEASQGIPAGATHLKTLQIRHRKYNKVEKKFKRSEVNLDCHGTYVEGEEDDCVDKPTAVLAVTFFKSSAAIPTRNVYRPTFIDRELLVLTDQKLTSLRDKVVCAADLCVVEGEYSQHPDAPQDTKQQEVYRSSYFVIENTFYNDMRDPLSNDMSKVVIDWSKKKKNMHSKLMDDVTFNELNIRLGYPYLYCHLGNCQHIMVFTDLRLLTNTDCQDLSRYPVLIHKPYWQRIICVCCRIYTARWKTSGDSFSAVDPSFFCDKCFRMLHYDKEGNKLGSFAAYPYTDPGIFS